MCIVRTLMIIILHHHYGKRERMQEMSVIQLFISEVGNSDVLEREIVSWAM